MGYKGTYVPTTVIKVWITWNEHASETTAVFEIFSLSFPFAWNVALIQLVTRGKHFYPATQTGDRNNIVFLWNTLLVTQSLFPLTLCKILRMFITLIRIICRASFWIREGSEINIKKERNIVHAIQLYIYILTVIHWMASWHSMLKFLNYFRAERREFETASIHFWISISRRSRFMSV